MKKFEYIKLSMPEVSGENGPAFDLNKLNKLGEDGWELVTVMGGTVLFKREKQGSRPITEHSYPQR